MSDTKEIEKFWEEKWEEIKPGNPRWKLGEEHMDQIYGALQKLGLFRDQDIIVGELASDTPKERIFIPCSGDSLMGIHFYNRGHPVCCLDIVTKATLSLIQRFQELAHVTFPETPDLIFEPNATAEPNEAAAFKVWKSSCGK